MNEKQLGLEVLDYPFLGYREIMAVLKCTATVAYEVIDDVMNGKDENGSPLVDQSKCHRSSRRKYLHQCSVKNTEYEKN